MHKSNNLHHDNDNSSFNHSLDYLLEGIGKIKRKKLIQLLERLNWYNSGKLVDQFQLDGTHYSIRDIKSLLQEFSGRKQSKISTITNEDKFIKSIHNRKLDHLLSNNDKKKKYINIKEWFHLH